jgi:transcriptional regulator GlxA family with amidase domain
MKIHPEDERTAGTHTKLFKQSGQDLVQRAELLVLAHLDEPSLRVAVLARTLGVGERTLRKAFKSTDAMSPSRHLRMLRLSQARQALLSAGDEVVTVTEIATTFGFAELGRFSVEYRKAFGESPSVTLRHRISSHGNSRALQRTPPSLAIGAYG